MLCADELVLGAEDVVVDVEFYHCVVEFVEEFVTEIFVLGQIP